jgi:glucosamine 6-phosphate synthetase-like amidotransferase/phosphosugar isomerase protein
MHAILKCPGTVSLTKNLVIQYGKRKAKVADFDLFLGHTQAPTSAKRTFSPKTSHPFQYKEWIIAHNGVLTNDKALKATIKDKKAYNIVDSSVIAPLIDISFKKTKDEVTAICNALSSLRGTFGLWIYNEKSANTYIARSGSTLYANFLTNNFSSINSGDLVSLEEGLLYLLTKEGITSVGKFNTKSPFFNA